MYKLQPELAKARRKRDEILNHPEYSSKRRQDLTDMLKSESNYHSAVLEIPSSGTSMGVTKSAEGEIDSPHKLREQVEQIWDWASKEFGQIYGQNGGLAEDFIIELNQRFEPNNWGYRNGKVFMKGLRYVPPNPLKVPELMSSLVEQVNERKDMSLEQALQTHFHVIRIQPFEDGNKRTARMVQNLLLDYGGYFPIVIKQAESKFYMDLLESAMRAFQERDAVAAPGANAYLAGNLSNEELVFFNYLISKEMTSMEDVEKELSENRSFGIDLKTEPGKLFEVKKVISNFFRRRHLKHKFKTDKAARRLEVTGNISKEQIATILDSAVHKLRPSQYDLEILR